MTELEWNDFLHHLSQVLLTIDQREEPEQRLFSPEAHQTGYLGREGATEEQLSAAEQRLGVKLPPSYRTFLSVSNGWPMMSFAAAPGELWSTNDIKSVRDQQPDLLGWAPDPYFDLSPQEHLLHREDPTSFRGAYIQNLLSISDHGDACDLLLSPEVVDEAAEWECWKFASWYPGAGRWPSFEHWMQEEYQTFHEELENLTSS